MSFFLMVVMFALVSVLEGDLFCWRVMRDGEVVLLVVEMLVLVLGLGCMAALLVLSGRWGGGDCFCRLLATCVGSLWSYLFFGRT